MQNIVEEQRALVRQRTLTQQRKLQKTHLHIPSLIHSSNCQLETKLGVFFQHFILNMSKIVFIIYFPPSLASICSFFLHIYQHNQPSKSLCKLKSGNHTQSPFLTPLIQPISRDFKFHYTLSPKSGISPQTLYQSFMSTAIAEAEIWYFSNKITLMHESTHIFL